VEDGSCQVAPGVSPLPAEHVCTDDPNLIEYWGITGYRKIPISTCSGGAELEFGGERKSCPNHEEEFEKKYGVSGSVIFFAIILPIAAAAGVGWYVWKKWDGKFGRIRLGDGGISGDSPWVAWPVAIISALVAVIASIPLVVGSLWRGVSSRFNRGGYAVPTYTSRDSFARGRGDYSTVDNDEGVLLGDESDEEV
jgi:hypothetical protein